MIIILKSWAGEVHFLVEKHLTEESGFIGINFKWRYTSSEFSHYFGLNEIRVINRRDLNTLVGALKSVHRNIFWKVVEREITPIYDFARPSATISLQDYAKENNRSIQDSYKDWHGAISIGLRKGGLALLKSDLEKLY